MINLKSYSLFESTRVNFYHGSVKKFDLGFILSPQKDGYVTKENMLESIFEKYRPSYKISRFDCVFMIDNPDDIDAAGGYDDYIYEVLPLGEFEKSDMAWYTEADMLISDGANESDVKKFVDNYWKGVQFTNKDYSLFEYRTKFAKIIRLL